MKQSTFLSVSTPLLALLLVSACGSKKETSSYLPTAPVKTIIIGGEDVRMTPKATVFKTNGNYADNVAVTLNPDGTLAYYPDPSDLSDFSSPLSLGNGWFLNRQGIGPNSVFTSYTFEEYRSLSQPPTQEELLKAIIPGAAVTEFVQLPVEASEALQNPEICVQYLPHP